MALNMAKGLIAMPAMDVALATRKVDGVGMNYLGARRLDGLCFHRAQGYGAAGWLSRPDVAGLTDLVIHPTSGSMVRINQITGTSSDMSGWAQGPYRAQMASADGKAFVAAHGNNPNSINMHLESIEVEGWYDDPVGEACKANLVQWTASRAHDDGIQWDQFPLRDSGLTILFGHREFCGTDYKLCPGSVVWTFVNGELIDRVQAMLKKAQTGSTPTPAPIYRKATIPAVLKAEPLAQMATLNGKTLTLVNRSYVATKPTPCHVAASRTSAKTRKDMTVGEDAFLVYVFDAGGEQWALSKYGSRIPTKDMKQLAGADSA